MMNRANLFLVWVVCCIGVLQGCNDGFEPSLLEKPSILALRATQDPDVESGRIYHLEALTHDVSSVEWTVCPAPWIPTVDGVICPVPDFTFSLPPGGEAFTATLDLTGVPVADGTPLYIRADADDDSVVPAIMSVVLGTTPRNPSLSGLLIDGVSSDTWTRAEEGSVELSLEWTHADEAEGATTAFFTTGGKFKPWRTTDGGSSVLDFQGVEDSITVYAISRYLGEGTSWVTVEVTP
jgi:hypothetical protein